jgi:hypothetical protein
MTDDKVVPFIPRPPRADADCDELLGMARQIKEVAKDLVKFVEELERDGFQIGSDAIGYCLTELEELRRRWFKPTPLPPPGGEFPF